MPKFLNTFGNAVLAIGICDRCRFKFPLTKLRKDPDDPGLRVCADCRDELDPYKLPAKSADRVAIRYARPDTPLNSGSS